jgi:hypothetical protein
LKYIFRKKSGALHPSDDESLQMLAKIPEGDEVVIEHKKQRNAGNHRRFFAFVKVTFDMQDDFEDQEVWRKYLEMCAGHFHTIISPKTGESMYIADSINWESLEETDFKELFNRVINAFISRYGQQLDQTQLSMVVGF